MSSDSDFDMDKICDRLRYSLRQKRISYLKVARDVGVSRDLVFDYTNPNYSEKSMQVKALIKFADYLRIPCYRYKAYEGGECRLPQEVFDKLRR